MASLPDAAPRRHGIAIALVAAGVIVIDQLTKWWAMRALSERSIAVAWTLELRLARNSGAAFSFAAGTGWSRWIPLAALGLVAYIVWRGRMIASRPGAVAIGLIIGGAVGNLIDRLLRDRDAGFFQGSVVDFIDFQWWPVFNVADMGVVVGGLLLVLVGLRVGDDRDGDETVLGSRDFDAEADATTRDRPSAS
jgi:signal peptidase II